MTGVGDGEIRMCPAKQIARLFNQMADLLEYQGENPFRIRAYRRAAQQLEAFAGDLTHLAETGQLQTLPGIGPDLAEKITAHLTTGTIPAIERARAELPPGVLDLLEVPGVGPKTARLLTQRLHLTTVQAVEEAAKTHRLQRLPGFKEKKEAQLLKGIAIFKQGQARIHLGRALPFAQELLHRVRAIPGVTRVELAGSLRRMQETIGDMDLLAASTQSARVIEAFCHLKGVTQVLASGVTKASVMTSEGIQVDLRVVAAESFGAALQYFTGSKEHNVRLRTLAVRQGLKVNEYGVFRLKTERRLGGREEVEVYRALGLPWIPPELREDHGEIEAAQANRLPVLVDATAVQGDFHIHSTWSDGTDQLDALANEGERRGYSYLAICDHSQSLHVAHGMSVARLRQQMDVIRTLNAEGRRCRLLMGAEVDILRDGTMDYPDAVLAELDFVIGSIHSGFTQSEATLTRRLIRAMRNPYVTMIAHPTGRLMGQRDPYPLDVEAVFRAAHETHTAMEINAYPRRLDLCDTAAKQAHEAGVMLAISTDTHSLDQLDQMAFGLGVARRAWLEPRHLLNCLSLPDLLAWIASKRKAGRP